VYRNYLIPLVFTLTIDEKFSLLVGQTSSLGSQFCARLFGSMTIRDVNSDGTISWRDRARYMVCREVDQSAGPVSDRARQLGDEIQVIREELATYRA